MVGNFLDYSGMCFKWFQLGFETNFILRLIGHVVICSQLLFVIGAPSCKKD